MRYISAPTLSFFAFFFLMSAAIPTQPFNDPGALWHPRVGEWMVEHREFIRTDVFTFPFAGQFWVPQWWGAEIVMAGLSAIGGFDALFTATAALVAGLGAWLCARHIAAGLHPLPAFGLVAGGLVACLFHIYARPHMVTLVFMAGFAGFLVDLDRGRSGSWLKIVLATVVWTNLHGGVLGGLGTLVAALAGWAVWRLLGKPSPLDNFRSCARGALWIALAMLATLINPFGTDMHRMWFRLVDSRVVRELVVEHQPLDTNTTFGKGILAVGCFYLLMLLGTLPKWPRITWLLPVLWFAASLVSIRHGPIFAVVALVVLADLLPETLWWRWLKRNGDSLIGERQENVWSARRCLTLPALLLMICFGLQAAKVPIPLVVMGERRLDPKAIPTDLAEPLRRYGEEHPGAIIFNDANLGGFVRHFAPTLKIFMDDRCELYGDGWLKRYVDAMTAHPEAFEEWAAQWPFEWAVLSTDPQFKLVEYLGRNSGWKEVHRCELAVIFERRPAFK